MNVLIIGATSAIAEEVAKIYAYQGAQLALLGRNTQQLQVTADDLKVRGAKNVSHRSLDLRDVEKSANAIEDVFKTFKIVDIVLLAHGALGNQSEMESDARKALDNLNTNLFSHVGILTILASFMRNQKSGTIAVLSSVAGDRGRQSNYIYGAAMAGKAAFTDGLRNRLFRDDIHVMTIKLGFVDTPMTQDFRKNFLWAKPEYVAKHIVRAVDKKKNAVYLPWFWYWIMMVIRNIPESIFKRLRF